MVSPLSNLATARSINIVAQEGQDVFVGTIKKPKDKLSQPHWVKTSSGRSMFGMPAGYPYEEALIDLSANEAKMFKYILDYYDFKTGFSTVNTHNMTPTEKNVLSSGYKDLHKRGLVKRVKKFTYLINPDAKMHSNYDDHVVLWNNTP